MRIFRYSTPARAAPESVCEADQFRSHWPDAVPTVQAAWHLIFAPEASDPSKL
jgi:hypothetical protein